VRGGFIARFSIKVREKEKRKRGLPHTKKEKIWREKRDATKSALF